MRKLLLFACALFGFMACTQNPIEEQSAIRTDTPETLRVGFEDDETRIQLNEAQKTVWTKDDLVSVFYRSDANQKWQYQGETGERVGDLKCVENATSTTKTTKTIVVYPYSEDYWLNTDSYAIDAILPATQYYAKDSYGVGSNLMVSQSEFTQFSLKNVCGWLKLQLTGDGAVVKNIKFRGNNGEQVAGLIYVDTATAKATLASEMGGTDDNNAGGNLVFDDTILTEVTLDCGEGVTLGTEATSFYISLPPQTFANGFTVEVECDGYELMTLITENELVIERNTIQPMTSVEHNTKQTIPNNEIWYTNGSTTEATTIYRTDAFVTNIISNTYDEAKDCWIIKFDGDVTSIGNYAFSGCSSLTSATIPDSVTAIGKYAFNDCSSLTNVTTPDNVTKIGEWAFNNCSSLANVTIPNFVTEIGDYAFYGCSSLTSVTIPDSIVTMGCSVFNGCHNIAEFKGKYSDCDNRCLIIEDILYAYAAASNATEFTIPSHVKKIEGSAFAHSVNLEHIVIPNSVIEIGWESFNECSNLKQVEIPNSVKTIGYYAFRNCSNLTHVAFPDSIDSCWDTMFNGCNKLESFSGAYAASNGRCLMIPEYNNCIVGYAPAGLTDYTLPLNTNRVGSYFDSDTLNTLTIPESVYEFISNTFYNCNNLTTIYCRAEVPPTIKSHPFANNIVGRKIYVPINSVDAYKSVWSIYANDIVGYDYNKDIIYSSDSMLDVSSSDFNTSIVSHSWNNNIGTIRFDDAVTSIGAYAFDSQSVNVIYLPNTITSIGGYAFERCYELTEIHLSDNLQHIGAGALWLCTSLESINIPDSVKTIDGAAFADCTNLSSVIVSKNITSIGLQAFRDCDNLSEFYCKATTPPDINWMAFYGIDSTFSIYVPAESVEAYKSADVWKDYATNIVGYNFENNEGDDGIIQEKSYIVTLNDAWQQATSVSNPDSSLYDGVYESYSNHNIDDGEATMYIDIAGYTEFSIYVRSDAESTYDYVIVSELDSTTQMASTSNNQNPGTAISDYTKVTYTGIDGGSHRITVTYKKDGSVNYGSDRGYVLIPKNQ